MGSKRTETSPRRVEKEPVEGMGFQGSQTSRENWNKESESKDFPEYPTVEEKEYKDPGGGKQPNLENNGKKNSKNATGEEDEEEENQAPETSIKNPK